MVATIQDVVKANVVLVGPLLLSTQEGFEDFRRAIGTDVQMTGVGLVTNIPTGITEPGRTLIISRDRIALELSRARSIISRDYPSREDLNRLAEVAGQAIGNTSFAEQPRAVGFNIELIFDQDSETPAFGYLSRRLFDVGPLGSEGWQFIGGAGRLIFDDGGRRWTFNVEPRFSDETESRVFLSANLHKGGQLLPDEAGIRASLEEVWDEVHDFVHRLDNRRIANG